MLFQLVAVLMLAGLVQSTQQCSSDNECYNDQICNVSGIDGIDENDGDNKIDDRVRGHCECPGDLILSLTGECLPSEDSLTDRTCSSDDECMRPNERCVASKTIVNGNGTVFVCSCEEHYALDPLLGECRRRNCEDFCFAIGGDTCRNDECLRCWTNGVFQCNQFLPPTDDSSIIIYRRSSFMSLWVLTFFFLMTVMLLFSCVYKCCLTNKTERPQRMSAQRQFVDRQQEQQEQHQVDMRAQYDEVNIKIPQNVAVLHMSNNHQQLRNDRPPPYTSSMA